MALRGRQLAALAVDLDQLRARLGAATATVDAKPARWASAALGVTLDDWQAEIMGNVCAVRHGDKNRLERFLDASCDGHRPAQVAHAHAVCGH